MTQVVDLRCPMDRRRLFARLRRGDAEIVEGNLIEVACIDCRRRRKALGEEVRVVLHRFNVLGECVESEIL